MHSINISSGGVPKLPVREARLTALGLEGDSHRNRRYHGGAMRAICLYSLERIEDLRREGHPIAPGTVGENLTIARLDWSGMAPGVTLVIGEVTLEVTSYTKPCKTIRNSFRDGKVERIAQARFPGWSRVYARVVSDGVIRLGDAVEVRPATSETTFASTGF